MFVDRETGGFARRSTIDTKASETAPGAVEARQEQLETSEPAKLPVTISIAGPADRARSRSRLRRLVLAGAAFLLVAGAGGTYGRHWWTVGRFIESTDDAYVSAHNTTLAAKVAGYVSTIAVEDNTRVHAGDVIATIDDGDYQLAAEAARDKVSTQQATVERIGHQIVAQQAAVDQTKAQLASADAGGKRAQLELD